MKKITETLYQSLTPENANQLHIYAIESEEEWLDLDALLEEGKHEEILESLGYENDPVPCEAIPGREYTSYEVYLVGNFLVVSEDVILDI